MIDLITITPYSIFTVTVFTSICVLIFIAFTSIKFIIVKLPMWIIMLFMLVTGLRLLFPVEFSFLSYNISSFKNMPYFDEIVNRKVSVTPQFLGDINITVGTLFCIVWLVGIIISLILYFGKYYCLCKNVKCTPATSNQEVLHTLERIKREKDYSFNSKVIMNVGVTFPSEFGCFNQTVFINNQKYSEDELYYILLHELTHFQIKTNWVKLIMDCIYALFWWNPVIYFLRCHIENLLEIYVDAYVTKKFDHHQKVDYLTCVLNAYKTGDFSDDIPEFINSIAVTSTEKILRKRFHLIVEERKINIPICISFILILLLYVYVSGRFVIQPAYEPPNSELIVPNFTEDNSYIVKDGDFYVLYYNNEPFFGNSDINELYKVIDKN